MQLPRELCRAHTGLVATEKIGEEASRRSNSHITGMDTNAIRRMSLLINNHSFFFRVGVQEVLFDSHGSSAALHIHQRSEGDNDIVGLGSDAIKMHRVVKRAIPCGFDA